MKTKKNPKDLKVGDSFCFDTDNTGKRIVTRKVKDGFYYNYIGGDCHTEHLFTYDSWQDDMMLYVDSTEKPPIKMKKVIISVPGDTVDIKDVNSGYVYGFEHKTSKKRGLINRANINSSYTYNGLDIESLFNLTGCHELQVSIKKLMENNDVFEFQSPKDAYQWLFCTG